MNIKNSPANFVFVIPTLSNIAGLSTLLNLVQRFYPEVPVIIVNNDTHPLENKLDQPLSESVLVINNKKNTGFAKACNDGATQGAKLFNPAYFVFLNDDTIFDSDWVSRCISEMKNKKWVASSPLLLNSNNKIENYGYKVLPIGKIQLIKDLNYAGEIDGISAAALVISASIFSALRGFDQRFFAYLEDVDLFLRLKKRGYKFGVVKDISLRHIGQATSSKFNTYKVYLDFRNWILLISKHWSAQMIFYNLPGLLFERIKNLWGIFKSLF